MYFTLTVLMLFNIMMQLNIYTDCFIISFSFFSRFSIQYVGGGDVFICNWNLRFGWLNSD